MFFVLDEMKKIFKIYLNGYFAKAQPRIVKEKND